MTTILVTGSRDFEDIKVVDQYLTMVSQLGPGPYTLVQGGARGADQLALQCASEKGWRVITVPARWETNGRAAGPLRNSAMVTTYAPHIGLCFRKNMSRGSTDCLNKMYQYQKQPNSRLKWVLVADSF